MKKYDVIVVGGGPAGIAAAIASARQGRKTLLLEKQVQLGGMGTNALVNNFCNAHYDGSRMIIGGIFAEVRKALIRENALFVSDGLEPYNHTEFNRIIMELCAQAGVEVRVSQSVVGVDFPHGKPATLDLCQDQVEGEAIVDATGDAVVAALAGASFLSHSERFRPPMPLTYCYLFGPVDLEILQSELPDSIRVDRCSGKSYVYLGPQPELKESVRKARESGELTIPRERIAVAYSVPGRPDVLSVNFGRIAIDDPTCPEQLAKAEELGKVQVYEGAAFFRKYVPGCRDGKVLELAKQIGVRESRQIEGLYRLDRTDVLECRQFDDVIAQCCYSIDIHEPDSDKTTMIAVPAGKHYDIPYRCLVPRTGPDRLIVAGRSISATQEAMSSFRVSPSVMAIGEAAGIAAAIVSRSDIGFASVDFGEMQRLLKEQGAILE